MEYRKALAKAAAMCSRQERCAYDIKKKLLSWELSEEEVEEAMTRLKSEKFIDDSRYAAYYVRDKFRFNAWGRIKIRYMLHGKGISSRIIDEALESLDEKAYIEMLAELLYGKRKQIKNKDTRQTKAALARFAQSRGFEPDLVFRAIDQLLNNLT